MIGDQADFSSRLRRVLPRHWFGDVAPLADSLLSGFGAAFAASYALIQAVRSQARLSTANGTFIDMIAFDFFGGRFFRGIAESDNSFRGRLQREILRPRVTRATMISALTDITGWSPTIFEPSRPADTGSYNNGGAWYGVTGGWGNLSLPYQCFIVSRRPHGGGIALLGGYSTGGFSYYGNLTELTTQFSDGDIYAAAAAILPAGYLSWVQLLD